MKNEKGFTLVEIIVVISVIGIMAVVSFPNLYNHIVKADLVELKSEIKSFQFSLDSFCIEEGKFPNEEEWENAMKENIDTDFLKLEREDGVYYKFSSKYEYKFQFIEDDNWRENSYMKVEFKISKNIIKLLKNNDFEFSDYSLAETLKKENLKDDFFKKYDALINRDGLVYLKIYQIK